MLNYVLVHAVHLYRAHAREQSKILYVAWKYSDPNPIHWEIKYQVAFVKSKLLVITKSSLTATTEVSRVWLWSESALWSELWSAVILWSDSVSDLEAYAMDKLLQGVLRFRSSVKLGLLPSLQSLAKKASVSNLVLELLEHWTDLAGKTREDMTDRLIKFKGQTQS